MEWDLLDRLPEDVRRVVLQRMVRRTYRRGDVIFLEGDETDGIHFIDRGRVAVRGRGPGGEEVTLAILTDGDLFGELALVQPDRRRTATVTALEATRTRRITAADLEALRSEDAAVNDLMLDMMAGYALRLGARLSEAIFVPAPTRAVRRLIELAERNGSTGRVKVRITQQELADLAGTSRQLVSGLVNGDPDDPSRPGLIGLDLVATGRGVLEVLDLDALRDHERSMPQRKREASDD